MRRDSSRYSKWRAMRRMVNIYKSKVTRRKETRVVFYLIVLLVLVVLFRVRIFFRVTPVVSDNSFHRKEEDEESVMAETSFLREWMPDPRNPLSQHELLEEDLFEEEKPEEKPRIPRQLIFTSKRNILEDHSTDVRRYYMENVAKTIHAYDREWDYPCPVLFLDQARCEKEVRKAADEKLLAYFQKVGDILKPEICRVAALYNHGGYYFDIDVVTIRPISLDTGTSFAAAYDGGMEGFLKSFFASEPGHPILEKAMEEMVAAHERRNDKCKSGGNVVPCALKQAYDALDASLHGETKSFLREIDLKDGSHTEAIRQKDGEGGHCEMALIDPLTKVVHFWTHIPGSSVQCKHVVSTARGKKSMNWYPKND